MDNRIHRVISKPLKLQIRRRKHREQQGVNGVTYLAKVNGSVVGTRPGHLWVHDLSGSDSAGNPTYGTEYQLPIYPGSSIDHRPNWKVRTFVEGNARYIYAMDFQEMIRAEYNPHQTNMLDPRHKAVQLYDIIDLKSLPRGNDLVQVGSGIYEKADGTFQNYAGSSPDHITVLPTYLPSDGNSVFVCVWLDTYTNEISLTASSEFPQPAILNPMSAFLPSLNEAAANRPPDAIGLKCYIVASNQTAMDVTTSVYDLRPFLHSNDDTGWSHVLYRNRRIWGNHQQLVFGQQTINAGKQLTILAGGQLVILAA